MQSMRGDDSEEYHSLPSHIQRQISHIPPPLPPAIFDKTLCSFLIFINLLNRPSRLFNITTVSDIVDWHSELRRRTGSYLSVISKVFLLYLVDPFSVDNNKKG